MTLSDVMAAAKARTDHSVGIVPTMLKCAWPRTGTITVKAAEFRPASTDLRPLSPMQYAKAYRASALDGISYAWDKANNRPHRDITELGELASYRPHTPAPKPEQPTFVDSPLVSKNGKRLPLAAFSYDELNRRFWSQGKTLYQTERNRALELQAHDKQPEDMTLADLEATFDREILSESRRSWLELGIKNLALSGYNDDDEDGVENVIPDMDDLDQAEWDDARYSHAFGTATVQIDPITEKQIDWEKRIHRDGQMRTLKIVNGSVKPDRPYPSMDEFMRVARRVLPLLLDRRPLKPALSAERVTDLSKKFDAYVANFIDQQEAFAHKEWHGHFLDTAGVLHFHGAPVACKAPKCPNAIDGAHGHGVNTVLSLEEQKYGPYHAVPQDRTELAIFNHEGPDEEVEAMMGTEPCQHCPEGLVPVFEPYAFVTGEPYFPDRFVSPLCSECGLEPVPTMRVLAA